jgi:hypothetical protein
VAKNASKHRDPRQRGNVIHFDRFFVEGILAAYLWFQYPKDTRLRKKKVHPRSRDRHVYCLFRVRRFPQDLVLEACGRPEIERIYSIAPGTEHNEPVVREKSNFGDSPRISGRQFSLRPAMAFPCCVQKVEIPVVDIIPNAACQIGPPKKRNSIFFEARDRRQLNLRSFA